MLVQSPDAEVEKRGERDPEQIGDKKSTGQAVDSEEQHHGDRD